MLGPEYLLLGLRLYKLADLCITNKCKSPINLLKFFDQWYDGETIMQLQYGPIGVFFTGQDDKGMWLAITEDEARAQYNSSAGEVRNLYEVYGPKLILAEYYSDVFYMEDRAIERLTDLDQFWMPYVKDTTFYPVDCVFTGMEMETIDWHKTDFETAVKEREGLWIRDGGPTDQEWEEYKEYLSKKCGMDDPNGFSFYKGECHLFYQYHPYSNEWGPMHWGPGVPRRQWGHLPDRRLRARRKRLLAPVCPIH